MRGKGSTIVTIVISLFLVLAIMSPICHSISHSEVDLGVVIETRERNIDNMNLNNYPFLKKLLASDGAANDTFGTSVSIYLDTIVVGALYADVGANQSQGSAYVFERNLGGTDSWGQVTKLTALDGAEYDWFGRSVSISCDTIVVGAPHVRIGANSMQGSAYVFERNQGGADNWGQVTKLTALDGAKDDMFGRSVSISGDTIVVGAFRDDIGANSMQGSAYVFERNQGGADNWGQVTKLTALDGAAGDRFGLSVSISGDTIIVGAFYDDVSGNNSQGSAYVFERNQGGADNWGQVTKLTALDGTTDDRFGWSVSISVDTIVVGANTAPFRPGSAYVFERNLGGSDNWGQVTKLIGLGSSTGAQFGWSVSISVDTIVVGAYDDVIGANFYQGSAYVFERNQGGTDEWGEVTKLTALDGAADDRFGRGVSVFFNTIVVGAYLDDVGANQYQGSAYVFNRTQGYIIPLAVGWNLISLPLVQTDTWIDNVLSSIDGKWDYIQAYNATDLDHWKSNATFKPDQLNDLKLLNHKMGFWVNITEPVTYLVVTGNVSISTSIPLYAGWNLVGYPTLNDTEIVANALWGTGADRVEVFDPAEPYRIREVGPTYVMKPGEAYWIHVPADTIWTVNW